MIDDLIEKFCSESEDFEKFFLAESLVLENEVKEMLEESIDNV